MALLDKVKTVGRWTKRITRVAIYSVGVLVITGLLALWGYSKYSVRSPLSQKQIAVQHELAVQTNELQHRIVICDRMIDEMNPEDSNGAAFQCAQMWMQMKRVQLFVATFHPNDVGVKSLYEATLRTAFRYAEYQSAINNPNFRPTIPQEK